MARKKRAPKESQKARKINHQPFWITLGAVLLLSLLIIFADSENLTGHSTVQPVSFLKAGGILELEPNVDGLKYAKIQAASEVKNAVVTTEEIKKLSWDFKGAVISMFKISSTEEKKFGQIELTLKLKEEELKSKGLKKEELRVYRNGEELATALSRQEGEYFFFKAISPGMGEFLIGKRIEEAAAAPVLEEPAEVKATVVSVESEEEPTTPTTATTSLPLAEEKGFFARIADFFKKIFS